MNILLPCHSCTKLINVILLFALPFILIGQEKDNVWFPISENDIPLSGERYIVPDQYRTWSLNLNRLRIKLKQAPFTGSNEVKSKPAYLDIPWPDGTLKTFQIIESPIMEKGLREKFPEIKTYVGSEVSDPSKYIRFDFTPKGFHGMVLTAGEGTIYIDPYSFGGGDIQHYISYYKKDFAPIAGKEMICGVNGLAVNKEDFKPSEMGSAFGSCELRTYRLALAATGEYTQFHGGTVNAALSAQVTTMNRVNGVYERDLAIRMNIIANNNLIIYTNGSSDPYSNNNGGAMLGQNQSNIDAVIGSANYDIGHVFSTGGGGIASLYSPCSSNKARGVTGSFAPVGDPFDIDYVCHEMGHQFGGNHTQNNNCQRNNPTAVEPGSASSIMGYAGICPPNVQSNSDDHFHGISLGEISAFITNSGHTCPTKTSLSNNAPTVTGTNGAGVTIPGSTPFALTAIANDPDGNTLTYCWEQMNNGTGFPMPPSSTSTAGPNFRSFSPSTSPTRYFPNLPDVLAGVSPTWEVLSSVSRSMNFRVSVRDNASGGGCTDYDDVSINIDGSSGPFIVTYPSSSGIVWTGNSSETVTWNVAGSDVAPVSCANVDILLSTDGGLTYPTVLATNVTNDGSHVITVPNTGTSTARIMVICANGTFFDVSDNNFSITIATCNVTASVNNNVSCFGDSDGSATANATGVAPFVYTWNNGQTTATATGLIAGTYTVTVTDGIACASSTSVVINEPSAINISSTSSTSETCLNNDGTATIIAAGGTGSLNYLWDASANNQVTNVATGLTSNTYSVTVTDNNGCNVSTTVFVPDGCCALTVNTSGSSLICNGDNNGTATVTPSGTAPYSYQWGAGQNTQTVTGLSAGSYTVTVTDASPCTVIATVTVTEPLPITTSTTTIAESCTGNDGSATINTTGSIGTISYLWDLAANSQTTATANALSSGSYNYTVTDANGCLGIGTVNILDGCLTGCDTISNINFSTDTVRFYIASAGPPVTFVAGHNQYGDLAKADYFNYSGLNTHIQGVYLGFGRSVASNSTNTFNVIVLDGTGGVPGAPLGTTTLTYQEVADSIAAGTFVQYVPLGNISLPASNEFFVGISFTYGADSIALLTNTIGETSPNTAWEQWGDLSWYAYSDPTGWNFDLAHYIIPLLGVPPTTGFTQNTTSVCTGGTISYTNTTVNGQSYQWLFPGGTPSSSTATNPSVTYNTAGNYDVTLIATNECISDTITLSNTVTVGSFGANASTGSTSCNGGNDGSSTVTLSGGTPPYSYLWNGAANNQTTATASGLSAGSYIVTITDATGCAEVITTTVSQPSVLSVNVNVDNHVLCYNGSDGQLTVIGSGGTGPYVYSWSNGQNSSTISGLNANVYSLTVSDANGCIVNSSATINEPSSALNAVVGTITNPQCNGASTGTIIINASGGTPNYTYNLGSGSQSSNTLSGLSAGNYNITVTDANSCTDIVNATLTNPSGMTVSAAVTSNYNGADISCNGASDGSAIVNVSAGLGPFTYLWSPGGQTSQTAIGLNAGLYTVSVTDANNCIEYVNVTLVEPSALYLTTIDNGNGSASTIAFSGTSPYTFLWDASANNQTTATATGLVHNNTYTVTVTDANGCTISSSVTINIVGLDNISQLSMFEVVPNPNTGHFEIRFSFIRPEDVNLKLVNVLGQILYELNCFEESYAVSVDLQHQASGVYFVVLKTRNESISRKVIVSK
ncbi:MAG: M12 family metallo-peptidase [Saprospiraceae bacterium]|nr:M12 family metallo-peptidase [Saprospiraceae bacterium]